MKKIALSSILIALSAIAFSQQNTSTTRSVTKDYYIKRSTHQKSAAWILLGTGAVLIGSGYLVNFPARGGSFDDLAARGAMVLVGTLSSIASIPLFIASARNKRRAKVATVAVKIESFRPLQGPIKAGTITPVVSVEVSL